MRKVRTAWIFSIVAFVSVIGTGFQAGPSAAEKPQPESNDAEQSPRDLAYTRLEEALTAYVRIQDEGGWKGVPSGPILSEGAKGSRVRALRDRLRVSGDLEYGEPGDADAVFTVEVTQAVKRFQRRHGLREDGIVGPQSLEMLNIPVGVRIEQIRVNMQRWRDPGFKLGPRYVGVNLADYSLTVIDEGYAALNMRVVIGKDYTRTPVFSGRISYLVFRPYWNIPRKIALAEIVPLVKKNRSYLQRNGLTVIRPEGGKEEEIPAEKVDWAHVTDRHFPYYLRQEPGPANPLGRVKFMLPNRFNVYLHDSPARSTFESQERGFSHGCIRVENALDLAEYLLKDQGWTREMVSAAMSDGPKGQEVRLTSPMTIHILYRTAWVDEDGTVHFRKDIYGRDHEPVNGGAK
jgi:L,D-transpeptidase YcbB